MRYQEYKITIIRTENNQWEVRGYWENGYAFGDAMRKWDLDGAPQYFKTRKEALEFCMSQTGIPE